MSFTADWSPQGPSSTCTCTWESDRYTLVCMYTYMYVLYVHIMYRYRYGGLYMYHTIYSSMRTRMYMCIPY